MKVFLFDSSYPLIKSVFTLGDSFTANEIDEIRQVMGAVADEFADFEF